MKFKLDENLPASSAAVLARAGHDVDTVTAEGLTGEPDRDVVVAAATAQFREHAAEPFGSLAGVVSAERLNRISPLSTAMLKTAWRFRCLVLNPTG